MVSTQLTKLQDLLNDLPIDLEWLTILALVSLATFILSLILIPWVITRLPPDYFVDEKRHSSQTRNQHPFVYLALRVFKNILGGVLIIAGILMLVLPGQGILTILIGLGLADFPGKFSLLRKIAQQASVYKAMNWIRLKADIEPLQKPK